MSTESIVRTDADALIPTEVSLEIIKSLPEQSLALSMFRRVPMSRKSKTQPVLNLLPTAYFVSGGDTGLKKTTKATWANKTFTAEEIACIVPIPENVLDDSEIDIWGEIKPLIAEAFGKVIDGAILFGTNIPATWASSVVDGAIAAGNYVNRASLSSTNDLGIEVSNGMGLVEADGFNPNGHIARIQLKTELRNLRDQNRQPIFQTDLKSPTGQILYNLPIAYSMNGSFPAAASGVTQLITGDFSKGLLAVRSDISYKMLDQAVITDENGEIIFNLPQQDMVALRCVMRLAWQVANPPTRSNEDASTRFPFAVVRQQ